MRTFSNWQKVEKSSKKFQKIEQFFNFSPLRYANTVSVLLTRRAVHTYLSFIFVCTSQHVVCRWPTCFAIDWQFFWFDVALCAHTEPFFLLFRRWSYCADDRANLLNNILEFCRIFCAFSLSILPVLSKLFSLLWIRF